MGLLGAPGSVVQLERTRTAHRVSGGEHEASTLEGNRDRGFGADRTVLDPVGRRGRDLGLDDRGFRRPGGGRGRGGRDPAGMRAERGPHEGRSEGRATGGRHEEQTAADVEGWLAATPCLGTDLARVAPRAFVCGNGCRRVPLVAAPVRVLHE